MKNLKKVLSVALALAMALSLMTTAFAAVPKASDLTGYDKVGTDYTQAVDMMVGLGVINGVSGDVQAQGNVTREQAAKIVCTMLLGSDASQLSTTASYFSDVAATRWSAPYIAYCVENGIVSGVGGGKFNPTGNVTGTQFAKMLLVALGYKADTEGYTGTNWAVNVSSDASDAGIFKGASSISKNTAATREQACLYAWNTVKATLVQYTNPGTSITIGDTSINVGGTKASAVTSDDTDINANISGAANTVGQTLQFGEKYFSTLKKAPVTDDAFGRPASAWKIGTTTVGTYSDDSTLIGTYTGKVTKGTLYTLIGKSVYNEIKGGTAALTVTVDGFTDSNIDHADYADYFISGSSTKLGGYGDTIEVYMDDDDNVTIIFVNTYLVQADSDYSSSAGTLAVTSMTSDLDLASNTIDNDSVPVSNFDEDDYILVTATTDDGATDYTVQSAAAAEVVKGTVKSITSTYAANIDGTTYYFSGKSDNDATDVSVDATASVVLDSQNNIIYIDDATVSSGNYVYISKVASSGTLSTTSVAAAYFTDGTYAAITLKKVIVDDDWVTGFGGDGDTNDDVYSTAATIVAAANKENTNNNASANAGTGLDGWYTYTVNSAGSYTLTYSDYASTVSGGAAVANGTVAFADDLKGTSSTLFVVLDSDSNITTYTGIANVPTVASATTICGAMTTSGYAKYVFIDASEGTVTDATSSSSDYVYLLNSLGSTTTSDVTYTTYNALVNGEATTVKTDGFGDQYTLYRSPSLDKDGYYTNGTDVAAGSAYGNGSTNYFGYDSLSNASVSYAENILTINDVDLSLASDVNVYVVVKQAPTTLAAGLISDGAYYKVSNCSTAKTAYKALGSGAYAITGAVAGICTSATNDTVTDLYITVTAAAAYYTLTYDNTSYIVYSDSECAHAVTTGTDVVAGTTLYVKSTNNAADHSELTSTVVTLHEDTAANDGVSAAVYSFAMPSSALTFTASQH